MSGLSWDIRYRRCRKDGQKTRRSQKPVYLLSKVCCSCGYTSSATGIGDLSLQGRDVQILAYNICRI